MVLLRVFAPVAILLGTLIFPQTGWSEERPAKERRILGDHRPIVKNFRRLKASDKLPEFVKQAKRSTLDKIKAQKSANSETSSTGTTVSTLSSSPECADADMDCGTSWLEDYFDYEFYNDLIEQWTTAEVIVSRLPDVDIYGTCVVSVTTSGANISMACSEVEDNLGLLNSGLDAVETNILSEAVEAAVSQDLGKLAEAILDQWERPCVKPGESGSAYQTRAISECTKHVADKLPTVGTLGARQTAAKAACLATSAELGEIYASGTKICQ